MRHFGGDDVPDAEWALATEQFAREGDLTGEVYALTSHVGGRCFGRSKCDDAVRAMIWRANQLARRSGQPELRQLVEIWRLKYALTSDDLAGGEASETRLVALGEPAALWLRSEGLMARAHLAAMLWDYPKERRLYGELIDKLDPADPRRALAMGGMAAATTQLALQGLESRERAERLVREALEAEERVRADAYWSENGYLSNRVHLALLLGPTPEAIALLRSALVGQLARGWRHPLATMVSLGEWLATQPRPDLDGALGVADQAVEFAGHERGRWGLADTLLLRSRIHFLRGEVELRSRRGTGRARAAGGLREKQGDLPMRMRYVEPLSVAYHLVGGSLLEHREAVRADRARRCVPGDGTAPVPGVARDAPRPGGSVPPVPSVAQVRAALAPHEALVSFQVWRPSPQGRPLRVGVLVATLITAHGIEVPGFPTETCSNPESGPSSGWSRPATTPRGQPASGWAPSCSSPCWPDFRRMSSPWCSFPTGRSTGFRSTPSPPVRVRGISPSGSGSRWFPPGRSGSSFGLTPRLLRCGPGAGRSGGGGRCPAGRGDGAGRRPRRDPGRPPSCPGRGAGGAGGLPASESAPDRSGRVRGIFEVSGSPGLSLLHLASHAVADMNDPERSSVVLAEGAGEDGRLEPGEIARLPLRGRTVVLAGCETSAGAIRRGEGVMSLARAFFSAGAVSVVGTLNRARDDEAAAYFSELYRELGRGASMGEAVAAAKRRLIARGAPAGGIGPTWCSSATR